MAPVFQRQRWDVTKNVVFEGMEVDIYLDNLDTSEKGLVECKFQENLIDAPIVYKLLGQVLVKKFQYAYLLSTSELAGTSKGIIKGFDNKDIKLIVWSGEKLTEIFMGTYNIILPNLNDMGVNEVNTVTLLVNHKKHFIWVAEEIGEDGEPCRAIMIPISENTCSEEEWKNYFSRYGVWTGLDVMVVSTSVEC